MVKRHEDIEIMNKITFYGARVVHGKGDKEAKPASIWTETTPALSSTCTHYIKNKSEKRIEISCSFRLSFKR